VETDKGLHLAADFNELPPRKADVARQQQCMQPIVEHLHVDELEGIPLQPPLRTPKHAATWDPSVPDPDLNLKVIPGITKDGCTGHALVQVTGMPECIKALKATTVALNPSWMDVALADDNDDDGLDPTQSKLPDMVRRLIIMSPSGRALRHPYGPALLDYAEQGCPVDTGPN